MHAPSAHTNLQGVEFLASRPILYSGGSFIDDYSTDEHFRNDLSAVYVATFAPPPASTTTAAATAPAAAAARSPAVASPTTPTAHSQTAAAAAAGGSARDGGGGSSTSGDSVSSGGSGGRKKARLSAGHAVITPSSPSTPPAATKGAAASQAAAQGAQAQAESVSSSTAVGGRSLVLQELTALPIAITHQWRSAGAPYAEEGSGNPPYFSQVRFGLIKLGAASVCSVVLCFIKA